MKLIFIHGPAAAGKLTIARALAEHTGFALFHNHLIVDAVLALFPFGHPEFVRLRQQFWLDAMEAAARAGRSLVFTFAPEPSVPEDFVDLLRARIERHGGAIHFVALTLPPEEQERRIANADRAQFRKLTSLDVLRALRATPRAMLIPPADLVIDTSKPAPGEAADRIIAAFGLTAAESG
jgi:chloramphenicol 3-O-phosphotransferase